MFLKKFQEILGTEENDHKQELLEKKVRWEYELLDERDKEI